MRQKNIQFITMNVIVYILKDWFFILKKRKKIFDFFEIKSLDKKLVIKLYDNL